MKHPTTVNPKPRAKHIRPGDRFRGHSQSVFMPAIEHVVSLRPSMLLALLILGLLHFSCDRTRMDKGYEYFPDMAHSPAYQTYSDNPAMIDNKTMREPVAGTIPRHATPYPYEAGFDGREMAAMHLYSPLETTVKVLDEGRELYRVFCAGCHGHSGDGRGILHTSGKYIIPPTSLISPEAKAYTQGELFHVITTGWGVMGAHGSLIRHDDRWKIIAFIENVIQEK